MSDIVEVNLPRQIRRRLERAELEHLRTLVVELQERVTALEQRAEWAERDADIHRFLNEQLQEAMPSDLAIGMTVDGAIGLVKSKKT